MFLGEYQHTLDGKNRVILPARFRERLSTGVVLAPTQERAIDIFPIAAFEAHVAELRAAPKTDARARQYLRVFLAGAHPETPDSQGRITIPERLRGYASLDRDLTITGSLDTVQIWDRQAWESYRESAEDMFASFDGPLSGGSALTANER